MAKKVHTRAKKKLGLATHKSYKLNRSKIKKPGPKTFPNEDSANKYASTKGIKNFDLKRVKKNKRFQIVEKT